MDSAKLSAQELARYIDHTILKPEATGDAIVQLCEEAITWNFAAIFINPCHVPQAVTLLSGQSTQIGTVVGFPFGANRPRIKHEEALQAIDDGAQEIDMVINLAAALEGDMTYVAHDIESVLRPCAQLEPRITLKVILECRVLPEATKISLCRLASNLGVDFVKTSTGLHPAGGAALADVKLLYKHRGNCKVKAAGGIRTLVDVRAMIDAGAERIGTSAAIAIMNELTSQP